MKGFNFPSTRTTNSVRLIPGTLNSLCENYNKRARLHWTLKQVLGTNLIPLRTKFDTKTKRVPACPVINQLWFPERHFSANGISLRLGEVQMKICKGWLQALLSSAPRGFTAHSRVLARPVLLAQTGELASRLCMSLELTQAGYWWWVRNHMKKWTYAVRRSTISSFLWSVISKDSWRKGENQDKQQLLKQDKYNTEKTWACLLMLTFRS